MRIFSNSAAGGTLRYDYATAPQDVFRRHDNCGCRAIYECGNTRQDIWSKQSWTAVDSEASDKAVNYTPPKLTTEQANVLEMKNMQYRGLTNNEDSNKLNISGATSGALNPDSKRADKHAAQYYEAVRKMQTDVKRIAENTGYSEEIIQSIKDFIFYEKHDLGDRYDYFEPDYSMAQSWQRLIDGKNILPHDLTLIKHEKMEKELINQGYSQSEAHILTSREYNYEKEAREYYDKINRNSKK